MKIKAHDETRVYHGKHRFAILNEDDAEIVVYSPDTSSLLKAPHGCNLISVSQRPQEDSRFLI